MFFCVQASAIESLSYSGRLVQSNGAPVTGKVTIRADLNYTNDLSIAGILCSASVPDVELAKGVFHVKFDFTCSGGKTLTQVLAQAPAGHSVTIQITDETHNKSYSYQAIHSIPYSKVASIAAQLDQNGAGDGEFLKWNNTSKKWEPGTVSGASGGTVTGVSVTAPLTIVTPTSTPSISIPEANTTTSGYISNTDWNTFNNKQPAITVGTNAQYYRGDKSWQTLDTSAVSENIANLYFTNARALGVPLTNFTVSAGAIVATDTILSAFEKTQGQINSIGSASNNYLLKNSSDSITGTVNVAITGALTITNSPALPTDAANKQYVDTKLNLTGGTLSGDLNLDTQLKLKGASNHVTVKAHATTNNYNFVLPQTTGTNGYVLSTDGSGNTSWVTPVVGSSNITDGSIVDADVSAIAAIAQSKIANLTTDLSAINASISGINTSISGINSTITGLSTTSVAEGTNLYFQNGRVLTAPLTGFAAGTDTAIGAGDNVLGAFDKTQGQINNRVKKNGDSMSGILTLDSDLKIKGGSNYVTLRGHASSGNYNFVFPQTAGTSGYVLQTDGAGNLSWINPSSVAPGVGTVDSNSIANNSIVDADVNSSAAIAQSKIANLTTDLSAINTSISGINSTITGLTTTAVAEGTNLYFQNSRVLTAPLTGFVAGTDTAIVAADTTLQAFNKTQGQINNRVKKNGDTMSGDLALDTKLRFKDSATNYVELKAPTSVTTTYTLTLPAAKATVAGQMLTSDTSGNLTWTTPATSAVPSGAAGGELGGTYPNPTLNSGIDAVKLSSGVVSNTELNHLDGVTSSIQTQFSNKQPLDTGLTNLSSYNTNGILVQTANDTFTGRSIAGTANRVNVANGDGVGGNPTIDIPTALLPSPAAGDTGKFLKATAANTSAWTTLVSADITSILGFTPVNKAGDSVSSGNFVFNGSAIVSVPNPINLTDAVNKQYVDTQITNTTNLLSQTLMPQVWFNVSDTAYAVPASTANLSLDLGRAFTSGAVNYNPVATQGGNTPGTNGFNTTTGQFKPPLSGRYQIQAQASVTMTNGFLAIKKNGSIVAQAMLYEAGADWDSSSVTTILDITTSDTITFSYYAANGLSIGQTYNYQITGFMIPSQSVVDAKYVAGTVADANKLLKLDTDGQTIKSSSNLYEVGSNFGIGTVSPGARLDVTASSTLISNGTGPNAYFKNTQSANADYLALGWLGEDTWGLMSADGSTQRNLSLQPFGGNVGIGTATPQASLNISGIGAQNGTALRIDSQDTYRRDILFTEFNNTAYGGIVRYDSGADVLQMLTVENGVEKPGVAVARATGYVGIGTATPTSTLDVNGSIKVGQSLIQTDRLYFSSPYYYIVNAGSTVGVYLQNGATAWGAQSDRRLKKDIHPVDDALTKLQSITGVTYNYKVDKIDEPRRVGVIAQDVQKVLPEAVSKDEKGFLNVRYSELVPLTINATKELYAEFKKSLIRIFDLEEKTENHSRKIASLEADNAKFKTENAEIKDENAQLKAYLCQKDSKAPFCKKLKK